MRNFVRPNVIRVFPKDTDNNAFPIRREFQLRNVVPRRDSEWRQDTFFVDPRQIPHGRATGNIHERTGFRYSKALLLENRKRRTFYLQGLRVERYGEEALRAFKCQVASRRIAGRPALD